MASRYLRTAKPRFTVETCPHGKGYFVRDNLARVIASGPWASEAQAAYECDRMRAPRYHTGEARPAWEGLCDLAKATWQRNPEPRLYGERAAFQRHPALVYRGTRMGRVHGRA